MTLDSVFYPPEGGEGKGDRPGCVRDGLDLGLTRQSGPSATNTKGSANQRQSPIADRHSLHSILAFTQETPSQSMSTGDKKAALGRDTLAGVVGERKSGPKQR